MIIKAVRTLRRRGSGIVLLCLALPLLSGPLRAADRLTLNFNPDWKFIRSDPPDAAQPAFNDRSWTTVSTPHTYNDVDTFDDWSLPGHRGEQNQWGGRTWYRKTFTVPDSFRGKKIFVEFEAARQVAEVYLNGKLLGVCKTGFTPFGFDLTPGLRFDGTNVLAVMCDNRFMKDPAETDEPAENLGNSQAINPTLAMLSARVNARIPDSLEKIEADQIPWNNPHWHPAHGGIYRNVYLHVTDPLHVSLPLYSFLQTAGPYVYATGISEQSARLNVEVPVENGRTTGEKVEVRAEVFDPEGKSVMTLTDSKEIAAGASGGFKLSGQLKTPRLWEPAYPCLYRVMCSVRVRGRTVDTSELSFGIRTAHWDAQTGFYINDHHLKLHGWGQKPTDEWPGLGAAQPDWMHFLTLQMMKEAGGNFVRWGHCSSGPASVAAADRLGVITDQPGVDGESDTRGAAWTIRSTAFRDMIIYYRNHPSILVWEGGNQKVSAEHAAELRGYVDQYDPHGGRAYTHRRADAATAEVMDIGLGTEGGREITRLPVLEGEYDREESPRRVWDKFSPPKFGYPEARNQVYDLTSEQYAVNQVANYVRKLGAPEHSGGANWIFSDSTSGGRVACEVARTSGEVDGMRLPKEAYYVCRTMFRADPQVHIVGHWTYPAGTKKDMFVVSNGDDVELFVNGKSLGHGINSDRYLFTFTNVIWEPGEIKAVSFIAGKPAASQVKHTAGPPVALRLTALTGPGGLCADGSDIALVDVEAVDAKGERCPTVQVPLQFELSGPAVWRGGYNSGKTNSVNQDHLDLECGINRVAVRAGRQPGIVTIRALADGLKPGSVSLTSSPFAVANSFARRLPELPKVNLPEGGVDLAAADTMPLPGKMRSRAELAPTGRYMQTFSYSGPSSRVHVETDAQDGKKIYADRDYTFVGLPDLLLGSDYIQTANADKLYNAVDLMQVTVKRGALVAVAHDDRLPRPGWLARQFSVTDLTLAVNGQSMRIFEHRADSDESLTLGVNAENAKLKSCNMYVVFVSAAAPSALLEGDTSLSSEPGMP
jgi:beta-galactosidase